MKIKLLIMVSILILLTHSLGAKETTTQTLPYINQLRNLAGLIPFEADSIPSKAADNHANYLANEKEITSFHTETNKENPYYTADDPWSRMEKYDYPLTANGENVSMNDANLTNSIDGLFVSIYHRLNFLSLNLNRLGSAVAYNRDHIPFYVYDLATKSPQYYTDIQKQNPKITLWPPRNYTSTQPVFNNTEFPAPLPECKTEGNSGNPISIQFNPQKSGTIEYQNFTLINQYGQHLPIKQLNDEHIDDHTFVFFPIDRLEWDVNYTAHFDYLEDGKTKALEWRFKTRSLPNYPLIVLNSTKREYQVAGGHHYILYLPPKDCTTLYKGYGYSGNTNGVTLEKSYDTNTIQIKVTGNAGDDFIFTIGNEQFNFHIFTQEVDELTFENITAHSVTLHWKHTPTAQDQGYKIFRDGKLIHIASIDERSYTDDTLSPNLTYHYTVKVTDEKQKRFSKGDFGNIHLTPDYEIPAGAYFVDIRNDWEPEVYGGYPKGSQIVTYEFRQKHARDEREDYSKRHLNPNFVQEISDLVGGNKHAHIILICHTGGRTGAYGDKNAKSAAKLLSDNGFDFVEHIMGGVEGENSWQDNHLPWISLPYYRAEPYSPQMPR